MQIDVSIGELVDKVSILSIKLKKIKNRAKRDNIRREYDLLIPAMEKAGVRRDGDQFKALVKINLKLWEIEDQIRIKEAQKRFDSEFIQLARRVYINNDQRAKLKRGLNLDSGSALIEEKDYVSY